MIQIDTDLMPLLPEFYRDIKDYKEIMSSEKAELDALALFINAVHDNFFIQTLEETAIEEWERILGISTDPGDTVEFRRVRIINRMSIRPPFTLSFLYSRLDELIGVGAWNVIMDYENYTMYIESSAANQAYAIEADYTVNLIKPAHIAYVLTPYIIDGMLMNEEISTAKWNYHYQLGGWGLGIDPFATKEDQGVIKMAITPSIKQQYLNDTAESAMNEIAKARINGSIIKTSLTKSISNSKITITYDIDPGDTNLVNKVEFLDSSNNVLAASDIYVPIAQQTTMKHIINVNEGVI